MGSSFYAYIAFFDAKPYDQQFFNAAVEAAGGDRTTGSAGLDVYGEEDDYFFEDLSNETVEDDKLARLLNYPNVLVTSHQAFFTKEALTNIAATTLGNLHSYFKGDALENEVCYRCNQPECRKEHRGRCF